MSAAWWKARAWISRWTRIRIGRFHGTVTQVRNSPTTVNNVVTYDCVIGVTNADYKLKPGMTANVSIIVAQRENALTIPNAALRFRPPDTAVVLTNCRDADCDHQRRQFGRRAARPSRGGTRTANVRSFTRFMCFPATGEDAKLQPVQIKTGISDGISTEVISGLNEGDKVVTGTVLTGTSRHDHLKSIRRRRIPQALNLIH